MTKSAQILWTVFTFPSAPFFNQFAHSKCKHHISRPINITYTFPPSIFNSHYVSRRHSTVTFLHTWIGSCVRKKEVLFFKSMTCRVPFSNCNCLRHWNMRLTLSLSQSFCMLTWKRLILQWSIFEIEYIKLYPPHDI